MSLIANIRTMDKRLRLMLLATALLLVPGVGQFVSIRDLNTIGRASDLALLFNMASLFLVPTSLILTGVILYTIHRHWREHERLAILGLVNLIIVFNLAWFFLGQCGWSRVFGIALRVCH
jgi:hypothetical protein